MNTQNRKNNSSNSASFFPRIVREFEEKDEPMIYSKNSIYGENIE